MGRIGPPWRFMDGMRPKRASGPLDLAVSEFAAEHWAVVDLDQLRGLGLSARSVSRRVAAGRLFRMHRGVYSVVPPRLLRAEGWWLAAVLACGPGAVLSHAAAAALWDLRSAPSGWVHVSVPTTNGRGKPKGIVIHRASTLLPSQTTVRSSIPVTKPARTLADLRRIVPRNQFEAAVHRAEKLHLDTAGVGVVAEAEPDANVIEARLLHLCRRHSVPRPRTQQVIGAHTVDFLWPDVGLVVETDGFEDHGTRSRFEADRARDAWLTARGYRVARFTWRQLYHEPKVVVKTLRALLAKPP